MNIIKFNIKKAGVPKLTGATEVKLMARRRLS